MDSAHKGNSNGRSGALVSINASDGGVPKLQLQEALITAAGLRGDRQRNLGVHGGPDRAVLLYSLELIDKLRAQGHPIRVGTIGENLTVSGLEWGLVVPGAELLVGDVRLGITKYATPCRTIRDSFLKKDYSRVWQDDFPGWSRVCARVIAPGVVRIGAPVTLI
jgi:MOSC domain-containing protein YiiM